MAGKKGVSAFRRERKRVEKEMKDRKAGGRVWAFRLQDGESAMVRFVGLFLPPIADGVLEEMERGELLELADLYDVVQRTKENGKREKLLTAVKRRMTQEEPILTETHWVHALNQAFTCDHDNTFGTGGCALCEARDSDKKFQKKIGFPKSESIFFLIDHRRQHRIKHEDGDAKYVDCTEESAGRCKYCRRADEEGPVYPARMNGLRYFPNGQRRAMEIISLNDRAKQYCLGCNAKLVSAGYQCSSCGAELGDLDADGLKVKCRKCGVKDIPIEQVAPRKKCNNKGCQPARSNLSKFMVEVRRNGTGKQTVYSFSLEGQEPLSEEEMEQLLRYPEDVYHMEGIKPPPQSEIALKIKFDDSRFLEDEDGAGASSYDDDDYDDEDEDDD